MKRSFCHIRHSEVTGESSAAKKETCIVWANCVICQKKTSEKLISPADGKHGGAGYEYVSKYLQEFCKLGQKFSEVDVCKLSEECNPSERFRENGAVWHKSCRDRISARNLERTKKKTLSDEAGSPSPVKTRKVAIVLDPVSCFFCGGSAGKDILHKVSTLHLDERVRKGATILKDQTLLKRLAPGDMIATDSVYHNKCLQAFYRRVEKEEEEAKRHSQRPSSENEEILRGIAFAELVSYINSFQNDESTAPVFHLPDLLHLYKSRLVSLGVSSTYTHSTRFRQKLLDACPVLQECGSQQGKETKLIFKRDVEDAFHKAVDHDSEALLIAQVSKIIRRELSKTHHTFTGSFEKGIQENSIPPVLYALISMILDGPDFMFKEGRQDQAAEHRSKNQAVLTLSQLMIFNSRNRMSKSDSQPSKRHHIRKKETPVPIYIGLKMHAETRKKQLVDTLYNLGLSISYDRVMSISTDVGNTICKKFETEGVVVPPGLVPNVFTVGMVDNIDHNPSSTTASASFHGTSVSLAQQPTADDGKAKEFQIDTEVQGKRCVMPLPRYYTLVSQVERKKELSIAAAMSHCRLEMTTTSGSNITQRQWLEHIHSVVSPESPSSDLTQNRASREPHFELETLDACSHSKDSELPSSSASTLPLSWGAFHASYHSHKHDKQANIALLPLLKDSAHSPSLIKHAMFTIKTCIEHLNPGQVPVIAMDQPLFAIAKEIQWSFPQQLGEDSFVVLLGGLHIELAFLRVLGHWLQGSGWTSILESAGVVTSGVADSFLRVSHVTRTRYAHEITSAALYILRQTAFRNRENKGQDFQEWCKMETEKKPMFSYWNKVLQLELNLLQFVQSIRSADFEEYMQCLTTLVPWFFALDHVHYARWVSVHLRDLCQLSIKLPSVHQAFSHGAFVINKTGRPFSSIALDHAHEQCNAMIKGDGGAIGLLTNATALRRWMVAGPEISRQVHSFEEDIIAPETQRSDIRYHHEQTPAVQNKFRIDVQKLIAAFKDSGNPFEDDGDVLYALDTKNVADTSSIKTLKEVIRIGQENYNDFVKERLVERNVSIDSPISRKKLKIFECKKTTQRTQVNLLRNDCSLFSRLFIACQTRKGDLENFFRHENNPSPPSLSKDGDIRSGTKSDLLRCLERLSLSDPVDNEDNGLGHIGDRYELLPEGEQIVDVEPISSSLNDDELIIDESLGGPSNTEQVENNSTQSFGTSPKDAKLLDGAFVVHLLSPDASRTFQEYADCVFIPYIINQLDSVQRLDVVWDKYVPDSLKSSTRLKRGHGQRRKVTPRAPIPSNWAGFLRNNANKEDLFQFLAQQLICLDTGEKIVVTTCHEKAISTSAATDVSAIDNCKHEEADTRLFLHAKDCIQQGFKKVLIRTADTDVVVLAIHFAKKLKAEELWILFGSGKHYRHIAAHKIAASLPADRVDALPIFHALTGCDTVSFFASKGKITAWATWDAFSDVTPAFLELASATKPTECCFKLIEKFVVLLYEKNSTMATVNDARQRLFAQRCRAIENIPPTSDALYQHVLRAIFQGGIIWGKSLQKDPPTAFPSDWGWKKDEAGDWKPVWTTLPPIEETCLELVRCGCKKGCKTRCKCASALLPCTALCHCGGDCGQE